jgi:hypothetical protein
MMASVAKQEKIVNGLALLPMDNGRKSAQNAVTTHRGTIYEFDKHFHIILRYA